ncbi:hypothetical protein AUEXF2481DRAFT_31870 [Aureobasidium subglaciale EXF-2481]|uniref:Major facilitator superfamily (MFS) profile domain-containing protein n=1 Tax=Aureobasidium subglaciale (strain EXF-2481) TaxID=1043005 RepID=A0A074Y9K3_AURSE|nr:uncharacterized protein AUEXF2481DRAFT_31870 [Aureobasidium subglaciale EXF-2481]KEQ92614.1 hypothetical protein AUEXF2481DRAFT_31870 [Aureobasidium subglaciale EXF-2481]
MHNPRTPLKPGLIAMDWIGNILAVGSTLKVLLGLEFGGVEFLWKSATVICLIVFSVIGVALFTVYESEIASHPVIPLRIFRYRNSISACSLSFSYAMVFLRGTYWLPLYFQAVLGANSLLSGVYLLLYVVASSFLSTNIDPRDIGAATSTYSFARQIGTSVSVVLGGVVFSNVRNSQQSGLESAVGPQLALQFAGGDAFASVPLIARLPAAQQQMIRTAYWEALQKMFILYACAAFTAFLIGLSLRQAKLSQEHQEHKTGLQSLKNEQDRRNLQADAEPAVQRKKGEQ